ASGGRSQGAVEGVPGPRPLEAGQAPAGVDAAPLAVRRVRQGAVERREAQQLLLRSRSGAAHARPDSSVHAAGSGSSDSASGSGPDAASTSGSGAGSSSTLSGPMLSASGSATSATAPSPGRGPPPIGPTAPRDS